jgi:exopolysaccharide biosynthesis WecB/TagA/CpsF family protein
LIPPELIQKINTLQPSIVAVGLGQIKQERFIFEIKQMCPCVRIWIGVGGAFEMLSTQKPRAPKCFTRLGFEWLWRALIEPKRWRRIRNAVIIFPSVVVYSTLRSRTFIRSSFRVFSEILKQIRQI